MTAKAVTPARPLLQLSFEDTTDLTARDTSGKGNDGILRNSAAFASGGIDGSRAVQLGGFDYVDVSTLEDARFPTTGTLSIWFRFDFDLSDPQDRRVFDGWHKDRPHVFIRRPLESTTSDFQMALQPRGTGSCALVADFPVTRNTWTHVVRTWDTVAGGGALYAAGKLLKQSLYATS